MQHPFQLGAQQAGIEQIVSGLLKKQIAAELRITEFTVKMHRGHVTRKKRAESLADLVRRAERLRISSPQWPDRT